MKRTLLTAAFAALALGAAQAVSTTWTKDDFGAASNGNQSIDLDLTATNGCATICALVTIAETPANDRSNVFAIANNGIHTDGGSPGTAFRFDSNGSTHQLGVTNETSGQSILAGSAVTVNAGSTHLLSMVYSYSGDTLTLTCYIDDTNVWSGFAVIDAPASFNLTNVAQYPTSPALYSIESMAAYDAALTADQIGWMSENETTILPEPTALALLALGVAGVALRRRVA